MLDLLKYTPLTTVTRAAQARNNDFLDEDIVTRVQRKPGRVRKS